MANIPQVEHGATVWLVIEGPDGNVILLPHNFRDQLRGTIVEGPRALDGAMPPRAMRSSDRRPITGAMKSLTVRSIPSDGRSITVPGTDVVTSFPRDAKGRITIEDDIPSATDPVRLRVWLPRWHGTVS